MIDKIDNDIKVITKSIKVLGVPNKMLSGIKTRALRTMRKTSGPHQTNRDRRWSLSPDHPQYGSEIDCKLILLKLFGQLFSFVKAPQLDVISREILESYLGKNITPGAYVDPLTREAMDFERFVDEAKNPKHGHSYFHIGHHDPKLQPKHTPKNINWRTHPSNMIQMDHIMYDSPFEAINKDQEYHVMVYFGKMGKTIRPFFIPLGDSTFQELLTKESWIKEILNNQLTKEQYGKKQED